jgi:hypothetical protein
MTRRRKGAKLILPSPRAPPPEIGSSLFVSLCLRGSIRIPRALKDPPTKRKRNPEKTLCVIWVICGQCSEITSVLICVFCGPFRFARIWIDLGYLWTKGVWVAFRIPNSQFRIQICVISGQLGWVGGWGL